MAINDQSDLNVGPLNQLVEMKTRFLLSNLRTPIVENISSLTPTVKCNETDKELVISTENFEATHSSRSVVLDLICADGQFSGQPSRYTTY